MCAGNKRSEHLKLCMHAYRTLIILNLRPEGIIYLIKNYVANNNKSLYIADTYINTVHPQIITRANFCPHVTSIQA